MATQAGRMIGDGAATRALPRQTPHALSEASMRPCLRAALATCLALALAAGCSRGPQSTVPTAPQIRADANLGDPWTLAAAPNRPGGRMPLAIGDTWHWRSRIVATMLDTVTLVPIDSHEYVSEYEYRITGFEDVMGLHYAIVVLTSPSRAPYTFLWRQDRDGFYEAYAPNQQAQGAVRALPAWSEVATRVPALAQSGAWRRAWESVAARQPTLGCAPGLTGSAGVATGEIRRLAYPLFPGQHWVIVAAHPDFIATIEGMEMLRAPAGTFAAWRVATQSSTYGPHDAVTYYWGNAGYVGLRAKIVQQAVDNEGHVIGLVEYLQEDLVDSLRLVRR